MSLLLKLNQIVTRHAELQAALSAGTLDSQKFVAASKEYADLGPLVEAVNEWHKAERELKDAEAMAADPDMKAMAEEEAAELRKRLPELERTVKRMLLPKDAADEKNAILEIRAGTGGDEAALFAADLFRMYQRYAAEKGWKLFCAVPFSAKLNNSRSALSIRLEALPCSLVSRAFDEMVSPMVISSRRSASSYTRRAYSGALTLSGASRIRSTR